MLLKVYSDSEGLRFFEANANGIIDTAKSIPVEIDGKAITSGFDYNLINGPKGEMYVLQTIIQDNQGQVQQGGPTKVVQLYTLGEIKQENGKRVLPIIKKSSVKKSSVSSSSNGSVRTSSFMRTDTAVFFIWELKAGDFQKKGDFQILRLANGSLSEVGDLPDSLKLDYYYLDEGRGKAGRDSDYIYIAAGSRIYRAGDTGDFSPAPLGDNVYKIGSKPGLQGEIAFAAKDNSGQHWIIQLKPDGSTEKKLRTKVAGNVAYLLYLDF